MRNCLSLAFLLLLSALALPGYASVIRGGETIIIDQPSEENHYLAGSDILVRAPIDGDLFAIGGTIKLEAPIADDVMLGGGDLQVRGPVGGDVRVTGGTIVISDNIAGDLLVMGGEVSIQAGVLIGGDLLLLAGDVDLKGQVGGQTRVRGGSIKISGGGLQGLQAYAGELSIGATVNGPSRLVAESISLKSGTRFRGDVEYFQPAGEMDFSPYLDEGATARYAPELGPGKQSNQSAWMFPVYRFLAGAFLIVLLVLFLAPFFRKHAGFLSRNVMASLGYGTAYLILVPLASVLVIITIIGLPVGVIMLLGYSITLLMAGALASVILAYEVEKRQGQKWATGKAILVALGIFLLMRLVDLIPFLGALAIFCLVAVSFGHLYKIFQQKYSNRSNPDIV